MISSVLKLFTPFTDQEQQKAMGSVQYAFIEASKFVAQDNGSNHNNVRSAQNIRDIRSLGQFREKMISTVQQDREEVLRLGNSLQTVPQEQWMEHLLNHVRSDRLLDDLLSSLCDQLSNT